ncbi:MAG TPA: MDR family MFS transporter [Streptosporangiaceae bacterium]|nr:MDR family MFS transporter [Streptosporangiaceae bacterium]
MADAQATPAPGAPAGGSPGQPGTAADPGVGMRREVLVVLPGLLLAIMLAMLDQLIVGTALPRIVGSLGGVAHLSWVVTAYVLASTITTPLYGKLGDMYGRKKLFMAAIVIFLAGSALAGLSQSMAELITFRAVQGLGAGGLMVSAIAIIGDLVSPRERGQYMGYIMAVMMIATIGGPLLGGFITDSFSWRWIFYINLPIGGAALAYLAATLRLPRRRIEHRVDYPGAVVLAVATTAIVLVSTWGGSRYAWGSPQILGLCVLAVVTVVGFIMIEARAAEPILPLHIFRSRNFALVSALSFLAGLAMFGAITFLPLYQQTVQGASPTISGLLLTPMMVGVMITSLIAGQLTTRTGRYRALPILGAGGMTIGMVLLSLLGVNTSRVTLGLFMVVLGLGMGFLMQMTTLLAQNSVQPRDIGVASSSRLFFQQIGGSIGVSAFGAIFARRLQEALSSVSPGVDISTSGGQFNPATVRALPAAIRHDVFYAIAHAVQGVFLWAIPACALAFVAAWFIKEVPLRGRAAAEEPAPELVG